MSTGGRDAGTKIDQPSDQEGQGPEPKVAQEAAESAAAAGSAAGSTPSENPGRGGEAGVAEAEKKAKPRRKPAAKKAEGTAAEKTGVGKEAAEAALSEGSSEPSAAPQATAETTEADAPAKPRRTRAKKAAAEPEAPAAPAPRPARRRGNSVEGRVTVRAQAKYVRVSARKARLIADHVRGKNVDEARAILAHASRHVAEDWRKLLESAIANAEHNHDLVGDDLRVLAATADEGPTLKRFRPRAMGRATRIRKRTSHLTITLTPRD
jgi:ribosomal protein L22